MLDSVLECIWYLFLQKDSVEVNMDPIISTSIHRCVNNSHDIKVLIKFIKTERFNITSK